MAFGIIIGMSCVQALAVESTANEIAPEEQSVSKSKTNQPLDNPVPYIDHYEILDGGYITPGEEFTLKITIFNPSVVGNVGNIALTAYEKDNLIYPTYGQTNSGYMGYLKAFSANTVELKLKASENIMKDEVIAMIDMTYSDNYNTKVGVTYNLVLPVSQMGKLDIGTVNIPAAMYVGSNNRISVTYSNNGLSTINDVTLHIDGDAIEYREVQLGSLASGSTNTSDIYLEFTEAKNQSVQMYFSYSDRERNTHETETLNYSIDVHDYSDADVNLSKDEYLTNRYKNNFSMTLFVLLVCIVILLIYGVKRFNLGNKKENNIKE